MDKIILWDFDGTLGYREGNWEGAIFELLEFQFHTKTNYNVVSDMLQRGFPWHQPEKNYVSISNSLGWWDYVKPKFIEIFEALGFGKLEAIKKAEQVSQQYVKPEKWKVYHDAIPNLIQLQYRRWKHLLVTNNVPEFSAILEKLDLLKYFDCIFISSIVGYNKPNPLILGGYLENIQDVSKIFVVGDRVESDLEFAKLINAEGILVHATEEQGSLKFKNLSEVSEYLLSLNLE